ncbi:VOC family protein [Microbacterium sp. P02]|uniref:VOC family protein n=1 Tax=Microbacterium sp. P02 TaxID=3366260 RepID=UPI00366B2525
MTIALRYCPITVDDVDAAIVFYRDALGLEERTDVGAGDFRWVTLGFPGLPAPEVVLSAPGAGRSPEDGEAVHRLLAKGVLGLIVFSTDDVDALFERVRATGAEVLQEPIDQDWGPRDCAFRDPAGNMIRVNQTV